MRETQAGVGAYVCGTGAHTTVFSALSSAFSGSHKAAGSSSGLRAFLVISSERVSLFVLTCSPPQGPQPIAVRGGLQPVNSAGRTLRACSGRDPRFGHREWSCSTAVPAPTSSRGDSPEELRGTVDCGVGVQDPGALHAEHLCASVQPRLKIEPSFAERFSNDTHQVPINSSKW